MGYVWQLLPAKTWSLLTCDRNKICYDSYMIWTRIDDREGQSVVSGDRNVTRLELYILIMSVPVDLVIIVLDYDVVCPRRQGAECGVLACVSRRSQYS